MLWQPALAIEASDQDFKYMNPYTFMTLETSEVQNNLTKDRNEPFDCSDDQLTLIFRSPARPLLYPPVRTDID